MEKKCTETLKSNILKVWKSWDHSKDQQNTGSLKKYLVKFEVSAGIGWKLDYIPSLINNFCWYVSAIPKEQIIF